MFCGAIGDERHHGRAAAAWCMHDYGRSERFARGLEKLAQTIHDARSWQVGQRGNVLKVNVQRPRIGASANSLYIQIPRSNHLPETRAVYPGYADTVNGWIAEVSQTNMNVVGRRSARSGVQGRRCRACIASVPT